MKTELVVGDIRKHKADMIVVNLFEGTSAPAGATGAVDAAVGGAITAAIRDGDFRGKWGETLFLRPGKGVAAPRVLVVGLGKRERFTLDLVRQTALPVLRLAKKNRLSTVASVLHGAGAGGHPPADVARSLALG
ncbi:MAG TPA: M17 family peptidase N-terminal domain-containing protein, partial [Candidatus Aquicultoraceae bacterium]|nr:M17 family peptidase N-terminal domain-containing protein [Candidatus Aquicultoraceae bacterium]